MSNKVEGDDKVAYSEDEDAFDALDDDDEDDEDDEDYVPEAEKGNNSESDSDQGKRRKSKSTDSSPSKRKRTAKEKPTVKETKSKRKSTRSSQSVGLRRSSRSSRSGRVSYAEVSEEDWVDEDSSADEKKAKKATEKKKRVDDLWSTFNSPPKKRRKGKDQEEESEQVDTIGGDEKTDEKSERLQTTTKPKDEGQPEESGITNPKTTAIITTKVTSAEELVETQDKTKEVDYKVSGKKSSEENTEHIKTNGLKDQSPEQEEKKEGADTEGDRTEKPNNKTEEKAGSVIPAKSKGLSGVLGKMDKKGKTSILDKSKLDWDEFKDSEGLEEELKANRNSGFLDKQDFLHRVDYQQWENERDVRLLSNKK